MKCGIEKADELTFEQPEEIAVFRKSKTGRRRRYTEFEPGAFAPKKVVPRVKLCSRLSFYERRDFLLPPLSKGRGTVAVRTVEGFCKDFRHNKKLSTKKNPLATAYAMWPSPL